MQILKNEAGDIAVAVEELKKGNVVAIPTETVYGLAANALDPEAVSKIFKAKGRPSDNPLIVHIADSADMEKFASDSMFTPAQLANYIATLLNKGKRYKLHLVDEILEYNTNNVIEETKIELVDNNPISDTTYEKVKNGMRQVVTKGTAMTAFEDCEYQAAGKTGTAEVPGGADNVLFVGFAPYDKPEIVVAVVIEHGYSSTYAARVARDIFDAYMELKAKRANPEEVKKIMEEKKEEKAERIEEERENSKAANSGNNKQFSDKDNSEGIAPVETTAPIAEKTAGNGTL